MTTTLELLESDDPQVAQIWRALEARNTSYFLSWSWSETWLAALPAEHRPRLAVVCAEGVPIAAGFLGRRWSMHHHLVPSRSLFLNATGIARFDELGIEHNGLVGGAALPAIVEHLPSGWDVLCLPAIDPTALPNGGFRIVVDREVAAPYVDLARVRAARDGYLGMLSRGTSEQLLRIRRALGPLAIEVADDAVRARAMFDELVAATFRDAWQRDFHRALIAKRFAAGEIELMRFSAGPSALGCLYSFTYRGRVAHCRDVFAEQEVGLVCQAAAIAHAAAAGHNTYDLPRFTRSLATGEASLAWIRVQRPLARFAIEDRLRAHWSPVPLL